LFKIAFLFLAVLTAAN